MDYFAPKRNMNKVIVNVKMELSVSDDCYSKRFSTRNELMRYALSSCFRNHTRTIIDAQAVKPRILREVE